MKRIFVSGCALQFGSNCFSLDQPCGDSISSALTWCETVVAVNACVGSIVSIGNIGITALLQSNCTNRCLPSQIAGYLIRMVSHLCPTLCHIPVPVVYTNYPKMLCFSRSSDIFHLNRVNNTSIAIWKSWMQSDINAITDQTIISAVILPSNTLQMNWSYIKSYNQWVKHSIARRLLAIRLIISYKHCSTLLTQLNKIVLQFNIF